GEHEASFRAFERAIDQLLAAGEFERAASALFRLLAAVGATGTAPHIRGVADGERFISRFPPGTRGLPAARVMMAMTYGYASRYEDAERELEAALSSPAAEDMPALAAYATVNRAFVIDHFRGRSHEALAALAE